MPEVKTLEITVDQLNAVMMNQQILGAHSICNGKLVVCCTDGYLRMIELGERGQVIWLDSLENNDLND